MPVTPKGFPVSLEIPEILMLTRNPPRYKPEPFKKAENAMAPKKLQVLIAPKGDTVTLVLVGEAHFDFDTAEKHILDVMAHKPRTVCIDAAKLSFMSSIGMCFLINLR